MVPFDDRIKLEKEEAEQQQWQEKQRQQWLREREQELIGKTANPVHEGSSNAGMKSQAPIGPGEINTGLGALSGLGAVGGVTRETFEGRLRRQSNAALAARMEGLYASERLGKLHQLEQLLAANPDVRAILSLVVDLDLLR
jgi:hypothetical protein